VAVESWRQSVQDLMAWLDWSMWVRCHPECGPEVRHQIVIILTAMA